MPHGKYFADDVFSLGVSVPIMCRRKPLHLLKCPGKVAGITESHFAGDLGDRQIRNIQEMLGPLHSAPVDVIRNTNPRLLPEKMAEIGCVAMAAFRQDT